MSLDVAALGAELAAIVSAQMSPLLQRIKTLEDQLKSLPVVDERAIIDAVKAINIPAGRDGEKGDVGEKGADGKDGLGLAGAMIDRDGNLQITMTNGEVKNLGLVVGKDGSNGTDGKDGLSLDSFDMEYLAESHEISIKAVCQGRMKEIRYSAGGIRPAGYWREGTKAKAGEAWVHDGSLWVAMKDCASKPATNDDGWIIAARKGRDGERGASGKPVDTSPIKLGV